MSYNKTGLLLVRAVPLSPIKMIEQVKDNFTQIPNQIIDDIRISDRAKAVYVKMRRCGPKWSFSVRSLAADLGKNQGTVARALKELEESGYIERFQTRGVGSRFSKMEYRVLNSPHTDPPNAAIPQANRRGDIEYYSDNTKDLCETTNKYGSS